MQNTPEEELQKPSTDDFQKVNEVSNKEFSTSYEKDDLETANTQIQKINQIVHLGFTNFFGCIFYLLSENISSNNFVKNYNNK